MDVRQKHQAGIYFLCLIALLILLQGCARNPVSIAETTNQKVGALLQLYNVALESARDIIVDENVAASTRQRLRLAVLETAPVFEELDSAWRVYHDAQIELALGNTTDEQIGILASNLESWTTRGETALQRLTAALSQLSET